MGRLSPTLCLAFECEPAFAESEYFPLREINLRIMRNEAFSHQRRIMKEQSEETRIVVAELFREMESSVTAYGPGAVKAQRLVDGTAFFPGGIGLWRGLEPHGEAPPNFPRCPIMILGHNFDKVAGLEASWVRGVELMGGATWLILRRNLETAKVDKLDCFFTNVFVGLQPVKSPGKVIANEEYYKQCRDFLVRQIKRVKPRLVATLGIPAEEQYLLSGSQAPYVSLVHPMYPFTLGRNGDKCAAIVANEAAKLRNALDALTA
jgi:hypothetical protein